MSVYIIDGVRTPIGNFGGSLSTIRTDDLAAHVIRELVKRHPNLPLEKIGDVMMGCANQAGEDNRNIARMASLLAGLPVSIPAETVNRLCASGMSAVANAARAIHHGDGDFMIAGGVEGMTRSPWVLSKSSTPFGRDMQLFDSSFGWRFINPQLESVYGVDPMGVTAENLAEMYQISRSDQDKFAFHSQMKASEAIKNGYFKDEIVPVVIPQKKGEPLLFDTDEFCKPSTSLDGLLKLKPAFKKEGSVTAGNSSGLNDGAAALLLANDKGVEILQKQPLAKVIAIGVAGVEPRIMGIGPVKASEIALQKSGLSLDDMDVIELNEAFAAQSLACLRAMHIADNDSRVNPNGGAIALGHPLGMSGARIVLTAARTLQQKGGKYALCTMCIGVGQGYAVVLEKV